MTFCPSLFCENNQTNSNLLRIHCRCFSVIYFLFFFWVIIFCSQIHVIHFLWLTPGVVKAGVRGRQGHSLKHHPSITGHTLDPVLLQAWIQTRHCVWGKYGTRIVNKLKKNASHLIAFLLKKRWFKVFSLDKAGWLLQIHLNIPNNPCQSIKDTNEG